MPTRRPVTHAGTDSAAGAPDRPFDPAALAWDALTSPRTGVVLGVALAALLLVASVVPQGLGARELVGGLDFAVARTVQGFELHAIPFAWPLVLLCLLTAMHVVGLVLRRRVERAGPTGGDPHAGRDPYAASGSLAARLDAVVAALQALPAGSPLPTRAAKPRSAGGALRVRRGLATEGAALLALGLVTVVAAATLDRFDATHARWTLTPAAATVEGARPEFEVRDGQRWLAQQPKEALRCAAADPADPLRRRACTLQGADGQRTAFTATAGRRARVGRWVMRPVAERPRDASRAAGAPEDKALTLLVDRGASEAEGGPSGPRRLRVEPGASYRLGSGEEVRAFAGPDGPLVVVTPAAGADNTPSGPPTLWVPALSEAIRAAASQTEPDLAPRFEAVTRPRLVLEAWTEPGRFLWIAGLALLLLGALFLSAPAVELQLAADPATGGTWVSVRAPNRPGWASRGLADLVRATASAAGAAPAGGPGPAPSSDAASGPGGEGAA